MMLEKQNLSLLIFLLSFYCLLRITSDVVTFETLINHTKKEGGYKCKVIIETVLMEQANFVIIDHKKYNILTVYPLQLKTTYAVLWIFWIFSRENYFVEPSGLSLRQPGSLLGVFAGSGLSVMLLWSGRAGRRNTRPGSWHNVCLGNTSLKWSSALYILTHFRLTQNETAKHKELGEHSNKLVTKVLNQIYAAIMLKVCPTIVSSN